MRSKKVQDYPLWVQYLVPWYREFLYLTGLRRRFSLSQRVVNQKLYLGVEYVYGAEVEGEIAEFGTMTGATAQAMAAAMATFGRYAKTSKKLLLFDSFAGLPTVDSPIDSTSAHVLSGAWEAGTCHGVTPKELKNMCARYIPSSHIRIYAGWFKDTLHKLPPATKLALLHIDSDLYQSAYEVLDYVFTYRLVAEGAALFFDDWNCNRASPDRGERKAWAQIVEKFGIEYSDGGEYGWSARKFIVHTYKAVE